MIARSIRECSSELSSQTNTNVIVHKSQMDKCVAQTKSGLGRKPGKPPEQSLKLTSHYTYYGKAVIILKHLLSQELLQGISSLFARG
jgi:hypothetical protein